MKRRGTSDPVEAAAHGGAFEEGVRMQAELPTPSARTLRMRAKRRGRGSLEDDGVGEMGWLVVDAASEFGCVGAVIGAGLFATLAARRAVKRRR